MDLFPLDIERIIVGYADSAYHFDKFEKCLKEIDSIKTKYTIEDGETISLIVIGARTSYYRMLNENEFEAEGSTTDSKFYTKYWYFKHGKIETFSER